MATKSEINAVMTLLNSGDITEDQRLHCMAKLIGYEQFPPSVEEILESEEYLGKFYDKKHLYPYWKDKLLELYPNPIETSGFVVVAKGAIGTGKSVGLAIPVMMIDLIKLSFCSEDAIHKYFGLIQGLTPWTMRFFNVNLAKAQEIFGEPVARIMAESPYWQEWRMLNGKGAPCDLGIHMSSRPGHILSEALFGCVISETNFYRQDVARNIIDTALGRMTSRFESGKFIFNHLVLDSSDTFEDSAVETFIKEGAYADCIKVFHTTSWDAKAHKGVYFNEGEFFVYLGDSSMQPFIMEGEYDKSKLDPDRILKVPKELYSEFKSDIVKSLQDKAGISVSQGNLFFTNKQLLKDSFDLPYPFEDEYIVDFYDDTSIMDLLGKDQLYKLLDPERPLYVRLDLGLKHDRAGLAITQFSHMQEVIVGSKTYSDMVVNVPFAVGLNRIHGQETPIWKIEDWVLELSQDFDLKLFTTDQYQSSQIRQNIILKTKQKTKSQLLSVDLTDTPYVDYKNMVYRNMLHVCQNGILMDEQFNIKRMAHKVDHDANHSKDISDAVVGAVFSLVKSGEEATASTKQKLNNYMAALQTMAGASNTHANYRRFIR